MLLAQDIIIMMKVGWNGKASLLEDFMARSISPTVLRIPFFWLKYTQSLEQIIALEWSLSRSLVHSLVEKFAFRNDEKIFVKELLRGKKNLWLFRCNQQHFCGDFAVVDMSSPDPACRKVYILDLKRGAPLKIGGGGAGIQFKNAGKAVGEIAHRTGIIYQNSSFELLSGDKVPIMAHLGLDRTLFFGC